MRRDALILDENALEITNTTKIKFKKIRSTVNVLPTTYSQHRAQHRLHSPKQFTPSAAQSMLFPSACGTRTR